MRKFTYTLSALAALTLLTLVSGCESEKIVESTEYIEKIEYVQLEPDTVLLVDSIIVYDSTTVHSIDTVYRTDTVTQREYVYDTVVQREYFYDTTHMVDTVLQAQCTPNEHLAFAAMEYYSDSEVLAFVNANYGISDGWVLYLSPFQVNKAAPSAATYQFAGVIDYWTPDWSEYLAIEFAWQITHTGGDPADPLNWRLEEPSGASNGRTPGLSFINRGSRTN